MVNTKKTVVIFASILIVILAIVFMGVFLRSSKDKATQTDKDDITRYQWIEMLCDQTGMTDYQNQTPYFKDVLENDTHFMHVQSAIEWELLERDSEFKGNEYASGRFMALTAMKAIGEMKVQARLGTNKKLTDNDYVDCAIENGLIGKEKLKQGFSEKEAQEMLEQFSELYFNVFWQDNMERVEYREDIVELTVNDILQANENVTEIKVTPEMAANITEGTVIIFDYAATGLKMARKVSGVNEDNTLTLSDSLKIEEIVQSLEVSDISEVSVDNILNYYQLSEHTINGNIINTNSEHFLGAKPMLSIENESKGFKISTATEDVDDKKQLSIMVTDNATGLSYKIPINKEVEADCNFEAELDIDKIAVATHLKYTLDEGVEYAEVALDAHSDFSCGLKSEVPIPNDKILLFETPTPLGNGAVGVKIQFYLVISTEGTITLEAELPMNTCVRYEKGKGICNFKQDISVEEPGLEANAESDLMLRTQPTLVLFMTVNVIDAQADIGTTVSAEAIVHENDMQCVDITAYFPIAKLSVCGDDDVFTLVGALNVSGEWEIITSDNAPFKIGLHYEHLPDGTSQFVEKCTYKENSEESKEGEESEENETITNESLIELNHTYTTKTNEVFQVTCPVYHFDYSDNWNIAESLFAGDDDYIPGIQEAVVLANDRGTEIIFAELNEKAKDYGEMMYRVDISDVGNSSFIPSWVSGTDIDASPLGEFVVAKIDITGELFMATDTDFKDVKGGSCYAVIPKSYVGQNDAVREMGFYSGYTFLYCDYYNVAMFAQSPDGQFTPEESVEIIRILSSFRVE